MRRFWLVWSAIAVVSVPLSISAGTVRPGETVVLNPDDYAHAQGRVLAKSTLPFSIEYGATGEFVDFGGTVEGILTSTVVRDELAGTLLFVYDVDLGAQDAEAKARAASILTVGGFGGFDTSIGGVLQNESSILASRTEDGDAVRLSSDDPGLGGAPKLIIRTDATEFASNGTVSFFAGDDLDVRTPDGMEKEFAAGTAILAGTFQPIDDLAPTPPLNPIPLPPAGWAAMSVFVGVAAWRSIPLRRFRLTPR